MTSIKKARCTVAITAFVTFFLAFAVQTAAIQLVSPVQDHWTNYPQVRFEFLLENASQNSTNSSLPDCRLLLDSIPQNSSLHNQTQNNSQAYYFISEITQSTKNWSVYCFHSAAMQTNQSDQTNQSNETNQTDQQKAKIFSETRKITLDTESPNVAITYPLAGNYEEDIQAIIFSVNDNKDEEIDCFIDLESNEYQTHKEEKVQNNTNHTVAVSLKEGSYALSVNCKDNAQNQETESNNFSIDYVDLFFQVNFDKSEYAIGQAAYFDILATNQADVYINIVSPNSHSYVWDYKKQNYPKHEQLPYTKKAGIYKVTGTMTFEGSTLNIYKEIKVNSNINAEISGDKILTKGEKTTLEAKVSGGITPLSVKWKLSNGTTVNSNKFTRLYNKTGTFEETLLVNDSEGNEYSKKVEIVVKNKYKLTITVKDYKTKNLLSSALIEIEDKSNTTNSSGTAAFVMQEGTKDLFVYKSGYKDFEKEIALDSNKTITVELQPDDTRKPVIKLITQDTEYFEKNAELEFQATDEGTLKCNLYLKQKSDDWYYLQDIIFDIKDSKTKKFIIENLTGTDYEWKIECIDAEGNSIFSEEQSFSLLDDQTKQAIDSIEEYESEIDKAIAEIENFGKEESEAADGINYREMLDNAKKEITRTKRDINNLVYRKDLDEKQKQDAQKELEQKIKETIQKTPIGLKVKSSETFVKYSDEDQITDALQKIAGNPSKKLIEKNKKLQEFITTTTKVSIIDLEYESKTEKLTLVQKTITYDGQNEKSPGQFIAEIIPKEFADSSDDIVIMNEHSIIEKDPIIRFGLEEKISYYVKAEKSLAIVQQSATLLLATDEDSPGTPTGFSISSITEKIPIGSTGIIIILVTAVLITGLFMYKFGAFSKKPKTQINKKQARQEQSQTQRAFQSNELQQNSKNRVSLANVFAKLLSKLAPKNSVTDSRMDFLIGQAFQLLGVSNTEMALQKYTEISLHYESLNPLAQQNYLPSITQLCYSIDVGTVRQMIDTLEYELATGNTENSMKTFNNMDAVYSSLPEEYKKQVSNEYYQIYSRIEEIRSIILSKLRFQDE